MHVVLYPCPWDGIEVTVHIVSNILVGAGASPPVVQSAGGANNVVADDRLDRVRVVASNAKISAIAVDVSEGPIYR